MINRSLLPLPNTRQRRLEFGPVLPTYRSSHSTAMAGCVGEPARSVLAWALLPDPNVISPLLLTNKFA